MGAPLLGNLEEGSSTGDFESWMKGYRSLKRLRGRASGRAPFTGEPER